MDADTNNGGLSTIITVLFWKSPHTELLRWCQFALTDGVFLTVGYYFQLSFPNLTSDLSSGLAANVSRHQWCKTSKTYLEFRWIMGSVFCIVFLGMITTNIDKLYCYYSSVAVFVLNFQNYRNILQVELNFHIWEASLQSNSNMSDMLQQLRLNNHCLPPAGDLITLAICRTGIEL